MRKAVSKGEQKARKQRIIIRKSEIEKGSIGRDVIKE